MNEPRKPSRLGIASCLIAIGVWIYLPIAFVIFIKADVPWGSLLGSGQSGAVRGMSDLGAEIVLLTVVFIVVPLGGHLLGLLLGTVGCFIPSRKRLFAIAGVLMNLFPFLLGIILFLIGTFATQA